MLLAHFLFVPAIIILLLLCFHFSLASDDGDVSYAGCCQNSIRFVRLADLFMFGLWASYSGLNNIVYEICTICVHPVSLMQWRWWGYIYAKLQYAICWQMGSWTCPNIKSPQCILPI